MPLEVYEQLWELHAGFDHVRHALEGLGNIERFTQAS
jgi:hypothetical protein